MDPGGRGYEDQKLVLSMVYLGKSIEKDMFYGAKPKLFIFAREMRKSYTKAEKILWEELKRYRKQGIIFRRQHPIDIFIADFYCHASKLVIEVDGDIHDTPDNIDYDIGRSAELDKFGITVVRFKNEDVISDVNTVLIKINEIISGNHPPLSRERGTEGVR
jgi:very-short-patch-repair endonuclease